MKKSKIIIALFVIAAMIFAGLSAYATKDEQIEKVSDAKIVNEIIEKRTLSSKAYSMSDGTVMHELFATDIHYKDESGKLQEIDIKVKDINTEKNNGYKFKNGENDWDIYFADKGKAKDLVEIKQDDYSISFSMDNTKSEAIATKSTQMEKGRSELHDYYIEDPTIVMYTGVVKNVDLAYTIREHQLKEDIILNAVPDSNEFTFTITAKNLDLVLKDNKLYYNDAKTGENIFYTENLFMEDSKFNTSTEVSMKLKSLGDNKYSLTIIADEKFLKDSETVYPVVIDPTIQNSATKDVFVSSYKSTTNMNYGSTNMPYLRTGKDSTYGIRRTYIEFRDSDIDNAVGTYDVIQNAYVALKRYSSKGSINLNAYQVTSGWTSSGLDWSPQPSHSNYAYTYNPVSSDWYMIYISYLVEGWESGSIANNGIMIRDTNESSTSVWATFRSSDNWSTDRRPKLVIITHNVPPTATPTPVVTATPTPVVTPTPTPTPMPTYYVDVAVPCDASYRSNHTNWESDAGVVLEAIDVPLAREFNIDFYNKTYVSWTSPTEICTCTGYCNECSCEANCSMCTCSTPGHCAPDCACAYNGSEECFLYLNDCFINLNDAITQKGSMDYVMAFTDKAIKIGDFDDHGDVAGLGDEGGSIIVANSYLISLYSDDIPFLHEVSHSYGCAHCDGDCIMNYHENSSGQIVFESNDDWCDSCKAIIMNNRARYGATTP